MSLVLLWRFPHKYGRDEYDWHCHHFFRKQASYFFYVIFGMDSKSKSQNFFVVFQFKVNCMEATAAFIVSFYSIYSAYFFLSLTSEHAALTLHAEQY